MKTIKILASELELETEQEYFEYVVSVKINWNHKEFVKMVLEIRKIGALRDFIEVIKEMWQDKLIKTIAENI